MKLQHLLLCLVSLVFLTGCSTSRPISYKRGSPYPASAQKAAEEIASEQFPGDRETQNHYQQELVELYEQVQSKDFAVIYNTGGFGGTKMAEDKDWSSVVYGIQEILQNMGFSSTVIEHQRSPYEFWGVIGETLELIRHYPNKAKDLTAKLDFMLHYQSNLKVIVTGRSNGAHFANEVIRLLAEQPRVYGILAGIHWWYHSPFSERTLVIDSNGVQPDTLHTGDFYAILKANRGFLSESPPGGAVQIVKWYIRVPGHEYNWHYPEVRLRIESFLQSNFGGNKIG